ncbi:MAG: DUF4432 family protein [Planctomycetes bacterium]|nr:DUF4432 family protein [Planctomycetota bacterium]
MASEAGTVRLVDESSEGRWQTSWEHASPSATVPWSATKRTLRGGVRDGVEVVELRAGALRCVVVPSRGMALWKAWAGDVELGWQAPARGPVHPRFVPLAEPSGFGWLDGFDELLCRCGLRSNGAPEWDERGRLRHGLHGRIGNLPAHRLALDVESAGGGALALHGTIDEGRLFGGKVRLESTTRLCFDAPRIEVVDTVTNLSGEATDVQLLYHVNFGAPLAVAGARLRAPVRELCPRDARATARAAEWDALGAAEAGRPEEVFFAELHADDAGWTRALLEGPRGERGVTLAWDAGALPCFSLWKNPQLPADGCVTGLEPATNYPNVRSFEERHGRVVALAPAGSAGDARQFALSLEFHGDAAAVAGARAAVDVLQQRGAARLHKTPRADWSPGG